MNSTKPAKEVRIGPIKASIWKNEHENGTRYNAVFNRIYKDGTQWKYTESFGRDDLLLLAKVANETHTWICSQAPDPESAQRGSKEETGSSGTSRRPF